MGDGSMSPSFGRYPPTSLAAPTDQAVAVWLRRLKVIGIVLPVLLIGAVDTIELTVVERFHVDGGHLALCVVSVLAVATFAVGMYFFIDHAYRVILRQNHELAAVNAVATAVNHDLDVDEIIGTALDSVLASSGALGVSITAPAPPSHPVPGDTATWQRIATPGAPDDREAGGTQPERAVDIPLLAGTSTVGTMRLRLPARTGGTGRLRPETLQTIGQQVGSAIRRAQLLADLQRGKREGHALYDVLLRISDQNSPLTTLTRVVGYARDLLHADEALLCLRQTPPGMAPLDPVPPGVVPSAGGVMCVTADGAQPCATRRAPCPLRQAARYPVAFSVALHGPGEPSSEIWLGRRCDVPFGRRDEGFLATLSELAVVALAHARMLENERHGAMLAERERIAREMHDSLAQVLGVTHLRLRALAGAPQVAGASQVAGELEDLADICQEAYRDVREAILGLHESSRPDRALLESLRAYVRKYSRHSGVATTLDSSLDHEPSLGPRCEVQVIRVIQEALTNIRKHSGARSATVRVSGTPEATVFVVEDDGSGFDPAAVPTDQDGFGLQSMRERMRLVNGSLTIDSAPGHGTRIIVGVPVQDRALHPSFEAVQV